MEKISVNYIIENNVKSILLVETIYSKSTGRYVGFSSSMPASMKGNGIPEYLFIRTIESEDGNTDITICIKDIIKISTL